MERQKGPACSVRIGSNKEMTASVPVAMGSTKYLETVNSARAYLRQRDFLTYASQLVPESKGSETWSLAWGYIRRFDDMLDSAYLKKTEAYDLLKKEEGIVRPGMEGDLRVPNDAPLRHRWLAQFFDNERRYYSGGALKVVQDLYESAWEDVARRGRVLSQEEMDRLLYKKARSFFKLYFILSDFDLGDHLDDLSYVLGMGLGILDDILDIAFDYESNYVNISREEMEMLGIDLKPDDKGFLDRVIEAGYLSYRAKRIMSFLLRARRLSRRLRSKLVRTFILRLTEIFAAPIIEGRLVPGQQYFFKGGRLFNRLLPRNESLAYKIGHKFIEVALMYPQTITSFFKSYSEE
jgi:hypothetical protein